MKYLLYLAPFIIALLVFCNLEKTPFYHTVLNMTDAEVTWMAIKYTIGALVYWGILYWIVGEVF